MDFVSQIMRKRPPELDPLRIGTGWKPEEIEEILILIMRSAPCGEHGWTTRNKKAVKEFGSLY